MFNKIHLFSHNDLDGYGCNVVLDTFRHIKPFDVRYVTIHNTDYHDIDDMILKNLRTDIDEENDLVIISDISWNKSNTELTDRLKRVRYLIVADHHKTSEWITADVPETITFNELSGTFDKLRLVYTRDGDFCGCIILRNLMMRMSDEVKKHTPSYRTPKDFNACLNRLDNILDIINTWDVEFSWTTLASGITSPEELLYRDDIVAPRLNLLSQYNDMIFINRVDSYIAGNMPFDDLFKFNGFKTYLNGVANELNRSLKYYNRMVIRSTDKTRYDTNAILFSHRLTKLCDKSLLAYLAYNKLTANNVTDYDCIAIWEITNDTLSLRYGQRDLDLSVVAKNSPLGGGGHKFSAGMCVDPSEMYRIVDYTNSYILEK